MREPRGTRSWERAGPPFTHSLSHRMLPRVPAVVQASRNRVMASKGGKQS